MWTFTLGIGCFREILSAHDALSPTTTVAAGLSSPTRLSRRSLAIRSTGSAPDRPTARLENRGPDQYTGAMTPRRLQENYNQVLARVADAARRSGRHPEDVRLVAVTKKVRAELARALVEIGQLDLGENYPQELWRKAEALADLPVRWHLIGHLQGNKAKRTYPLVHLVHAVDSLKLLHALDDLAAGSPEPAPVCLQINCSGEEAKHGWSPEAILADAEAIAACRHVPIVGVMTMAAFSSTAEEARPAFVRLREVRDALQERTGFRLNELSMGMSNDFEVAIEEGATLIRVGTALFEGVEP